MVVVGERNIDPMINTVRSNTAIDLSVPDAPVPQAN